MTGYIYTPSKHRRSGSTMQRSKARGSAKKYHAAREVLSGYPIERTFESRQEVEDYLDHERVTCLLCGKDYYQLSPHVKRIHGLDADDYRAKYGIPSCYGLIGTERRRKAQEHGRREENVAHIQRVMAEAHERRMKGAARQRTNFVLMIKREMAARVNDPSLDRRTYTDFSWHLMVMASIWKHETAVPPPGCASWSGFKKRWLHDPMLKAKVVAARTLFRSGVKDRAKAVRLCGGNRA